MNPMQKPITVAGDETTGHFAPDDVRPANFRRLDPGLLARLAELPGLTPTAADVLDELGIPLVVGADTLQPRVANARIAGHAITLRYLPERRTPASLEPAGASSRLAHQVAFELSMSGDVLVVEAPSAVATSIFGGMAAVEARRRGLGGIVVDGAIRDIDQINALGLPAWSRLVTPRTGKWRLEAVQVNAPIGCGGVQVRAGDLVLADPSGVCFIPLELADRAIGEILDVGTREAGHVDAQSGGRG